MAEEKDLMTAVGDTFGIKDDAPQQDGEAGGDNEGQLDPQLGAEQPQQQPTEQPTDEGRQETGSDRHTGRRDEQLFDQKPRKGPKGELLDKNGQVIATTRREKQLAYNLNRAQYAANQAVRESRRLAEAVRVYQGFEKQIREAGLSGQQVGEAIQLRAMAERDPITAVRDVVARVLATGVTMDQLFGAGAVPNIDARIITNELDRRLGPVEHKARAEQRAAAINERAQEQMEQFVAQHPHAEVHGVEISNLVSQHGLTPERAYFELRSWVERRGFDFTAPLKTQIEAAMRRQRAGGGGRRPSTPGDMRGVAPNGSVPTHDNTNSRGDFRANAPWRDIAAAVFTELNNK